MTANTEHETGPLVAARETQSGKAAHADEVTGRTKRPVGPTDNHDHDSETEGTAETAHAESDDGAGTVEDE